LGASRDRGGQRWAAVVGASPERYALDPMWQTLVDYLTARRDDAEEWAAGRNALLRLPLLAYLVYAGLRHLFDPLYRSWFAGITLVFHEMGHIVFSPLGHTLTILGGTLMQLFIPTAAAVYLVLRQRDYYGFGVGGAWLSFSLWEMATYVADANKDALPLVGFGDNPQHDWGTLLTEWHLLNSCDTFATLIRVFALLVWAGAIATAAWVCWLMWRQRESAPPLP